MKTILIIGAGYSGAIMSARLLGGGSKEPRHVVLVNGSGKVARGIAYGTQSPEHTLNVPVGNMSAYDENAQHFLTYLQSRYPEISPGSFVSRSLYGDYLEHLLAEAEVKAAAHVTLERITSHVTKLVRQSDDHAILAHLEGGEVRKVDQVVLALGHFASANPRINDMAFYDSKRFIRDPWNQAKLSSIDSNLPVLLLGTGLTAIDVATTLQRQSPGRQVHAVSRRGMLPQYHRKAAGPYPVEADLQAIWGGARNVREQMHALRQYCTKLVQSGGDWREALAILRPVTADIWQAYDECERRRFVRHVLPYWDSHRHRLAPNVAAQIEEARQVGLFQASAGRVLDLQDRGDHVKAIIQPRGSKETRTLHVGHVVNCTGPSTNLHTTENALVQQLLADGMIRADALGLGLDVSDTCAVVDANGVPSERIFYIGPWLKAKYWEATAVPDLRRFARQLAETILKN